MRKIGTIKDLTKYVIFSISVVVLYTIAEFITSTVTNISHDVLTGCVYGFFGGELVLLAMIKIFKLRRNENDNICG
jgi:hypothetical protein